MKSMTVKISAAVALLSLAIAFGGAAARASGQTVTITENRANGVVHLRVGDTLLVRLRAEAGPDYVWRVAQSNSSLLTPSPLPLGSQTGSQTQTLAFTATAAGGEQLSLLYQNSAMKGVRALDLYRVMVIIDRGSSSKTVTVTDADNGGQVMVALGDTLVVRLANSAGTGYRWDIGYNNGFLLQSLGSSNTPATMPGGRQYQSLRFKVVGVGNGNLTLYRHRSANEGAHAGDNFNISLLSVPGGSWGSGSATTLTDSDSGGGFTLRVGDTLVVRLTSNPTTGYSWNLAGGAPATLQLLGQPNFERPSNGLIGASGVQIYKFKVVGSGSNVLRLLYQRPFAPGGIEAARKWEAFLTTVSR